jgi:hypothetical protein
VGRSEWTPTGPQDIHVNEDREEFLDLIDHCDLCASHITVYLQAADEALQILESPADIHRCIAAAELKAQIRHAMTQQHLLEQLRAKARSICESHPYGWN